MICGIIPVLIGRRVGLRHCGIGLCSGRRYGFCRGFRGLADCCLRHGRYCPGGGFLLRGPVSAAAEQQHRRRYGEQAFTEQIFQVHETVILP